MEKKLIQFTTIFICLFSLFSCVTVWFLPSIEHDLEAFGASIIQSQREREERYALLKEMSALEILDYNTQQVQEKVEEGSEEVEVKEIDYTQEKKMRLELPKHVDGADVKIFADSINKEIRIEIPGADKNYLYDYQLIGQSDEIEDMDYFSEGESGTMVLSMSTVVDVDSSFDDDYFYLDFLLPRDAHKRLVVVDAGHGGIAPGAVSGDVYEKNLTLAIVQKIKALFDQSEQSDIGVYYTRLDDTDPSLASRIDLANHMEADLFVSIHINSLNGHTDVEGVEVMYNELAPDTEFDTKDFAQICLEEEISTLGAKNRGLINGNRIYIIRTATMPAALVEVGFMNNPAELARLMDDSYQQKAAQGIYQAILRSVERLDEIDAKKKKSHKN